MFCHSLAALFHSSNMHVVAYLCRLTHLLYLFWAFSATHGNDGLYKRQRSLFPCLKRMETKEVSHLYLYVTTLLRQEVYRLAQLLCPVDKVPEF